MAQQITQIEVGQAGGAWIDSTDVFRPPNGKVVTAINVVTAATFTTLTPANAVGTYYPGTTVLASPIGNGEAAEAIVSGDSFPVGQWIYGRWSTIDLASGSIFAYFGEA
jgi:hypothetical protein